MLSDAAKQQRALERELLAREQLEEIRARNSANPDIARLLEHADVLAFRLDDSVDLRRELGPLTVVDEETHYFVEVTAKQERAS